MKSLIRRTIAVCCSSSSSSSSSSSVSPLFVSLHHLFSSYSTSSSWRHHDEESRSVKVSVWWDFENCSVPSGVNVFTVAQRITSALRSNGINGPVNITAFGDVYQLSRSSQEALSSTGICLNHIPRDGKNSADRSLLVDLVCWVSQNPPPAHLFLISGDRDFANILHRLRMNNYNILLSSGKSAPGVLCSAATIMWQWNSLVRGEELSGKHFNHPPGGPRGSWYGYSKGPLEDPFSDLEQSESSQREGSLEPGIDYKPRPIPKAFVNRISQIVNSHPKGINIVELHFELARSNISIDKDFFGYKKFSRLLLALPTVLQLRVSDGRILVHGIQSKAPEPVEVSLRLSSDSDNNNGDGRSNRIAEVSIKNNAVSANVNGNSPLPEASPPKIPPSFSMKQSDTQMTRGLSVTAECSASDGSLEKKKSSKVSSESRSQHPNPIGSSSFSPSNIESSLVEKIASDSEKDDDIPKPSAGFFKRIKNWFGSWRASKSPDIAIGKCDKAVNQIDSQTENHELFSKATFWDEMESFLHTPGGSVLVSQSKTREQFALEIQNKGPSILNTLGVGDLLQLVDLLISEKKWVEECHSQTFPFKLSFPVTKLSPPSNQCGSNALSSIFSSTLSDLQRPPNHKGAIEEQRHTQTGAVMAENDRKSSGKSKNEILTNCKKLATETVKLHPEGFNMGAFKYLFHERYGYTLDHHKLGFSKLTALLQTLPGIKIESNFILPAGKAIPTSKWESDLSYSQGGNSLGKAGSDSELSDSARKDHDSDSPWEELGPVSNTNSNTSGLDEKSKEMEFPPNGESFLSDSELSDSDGESPIREISEKQVNFRKNDEDSSLLQILDSWYSGKDEKGSKSQPNKADGLVDCLRNDPKSLDSSKVGPNKTKPRKTYSFVSDKEVEKEKLIDSILGSLKKTGESKLQS